MGRCRVSRRRRPNEKEAARWSRPRGRPIGGGTGLWSGVADCGEAGVRERVPRRVADARQQTTYIWLAPVDNKPRPSVCSWVIILLHSTFTCVSRARVARALYDAYDRLVLYRTDPVSAVLSFGIGTDRASPASGPGPSGPGSGRRASELRTESESQKS
eukprot:scaffold90334_cov66-Phaeocystis_antarctica.AAC.1